MFYIVYKTTNLINQCYYIGLHKTDDLNDDYLGSGKRLLLAITKYGRDNFKRDILFVFSEPSQMEAKEAELVNEATLLDPLCYNLRLGGIGGWDHVDCGSAFRGRRHSEEAKAKIRSKRALQAPLSEDAIRRISSYNRSNETRKRAISDAIKADRAANPRAWINKDGKIKHPLVCELDQWIQQGWNLGRK